MGLDLVGLVMETEEKEMAVRERVVVEMVMVVKVKEVVEKDLEGLGLEDEGCGIPAKQAISLLQLANSLA